jgi:hypothetical protein
MSSKIGVGDQSAQRMMLLMAVITEREKESPSSQGRPMYLGALGEILELNLIFFNI